MFSHFWLDFNAYKNVDIEQEMYAQKVGMDDLVYYW
jgi:hypothetical protein